MKRLLTLATSGLFATGLAVLPVSVFAQTGAPTTTDAKPAVAVPAKIVTHEAKIAPTKDATATKDSVKTTGTKISTAPASPMSPAPGTGTPATGAAKIGNHGAS